MNGLSFFGLNFIFLGGTSAYLFKDNAPFLYYGIILAFVGVLMLYDDSKGQPWGKKIMSFFFKN